MTEHVNTGGNIKFVYDGREDKSRRLIPDNAPAYTYDEYNPADDRYIEEVIKANEEPKKGKKSKKEIDYDYIWITLLFLLIFVGIFLAIHFLYTK